MKVTINKKEYGLFGSDAVVIIIFSIATLLLLFFMNQYVARASWVGFVTEMHPDQLFPNLLKNGYPNAEVVTGDGAKSLFYGAIWLQEHIVLRYIVGGLFVFFLFLIGISYLYFDLFEQYLNTKLKTFLPRIVFAIILAVSSVWILQGLMYMSEGAYVLFWNLPSPFSDWKNSDFLAFIGLPQFHANGFWGTLNILAHLYFAFIWIFIVVMEAVSLLILVAVRDYLFAILIVILPIASFLLVHPWTQKIGSRLWWLAVDLIFLPVVMIIPLSLMGLIHGSVSFMIAGITITIGSLYLIAQEPFVLSGAGFTRAGSVLTSGMQGGALGGSIVTAQGLIPRAMSGLSGTTRDALGKIGNTSISNLAGGGKGGFTGKVAGAFNNFSSFLRGKGGGKSGG